MSVCLNFSRNSHTPDFLHECMSILHLSHLPMLGNFDLGLPNLGWAAGQIGCTQSTAKPEDYRKFHLTKDLSTR
jgi:hypothetical protein